MNYIQKTYINMKLGKLQKAWVDSLKNHPEKQMRGLLGVKKGNSYMACCLGELHCVAHRLKKKKLPFDGNVIRDEGNCSILSKSYEKYGLRNHSGRLKCYAYYHDGNFSLRPFDQSKAYVSLADMNDYGITWPEIATFVETYPNIVFTKSV